MIRPWSLAQRRAGLALLAITLLLAGWRWMRQPLAIDSLAEPRPLARLNINTAAPRQLAQIPGLSEKLAQRIGDYRASWAMRHPNVAPFAKPQDLLKVSGVGADILEACQDYLDFSAAAANTSASSTTSTAAPR